MLCPLDGYWVAIWIELKVVWLWATIRILVMLALLEVLFVVSMLTEKDGAAQCPGSGRLKGCVVRTSGV